VTNIPVNSTEIPPTVLKMKRGKLFLIAEDHKGAITVPNKSRRRILDTMNKTFW
jgi:hypothetical protein